MIIGLCLLLGAALQDPPVRQAPPPAAALKDAEKSVRELFRDEYAKKSAPDRLALARTLLESGEKTPDEPATRWVLLVEAREVAFQAGDPDLAFRAVDALARAFAVRPASLKLDLLAKLPSPSADAALAVLEEGIRTNDFDAAAKSAEIGRRAALKSGDAGLAARLAARAKEAAQIRTRYAKASRAFETLEKSPDDPEANLEVGEYACLVKGDWEEGLPFLAKGPDGPLTALARKDLAGAEAPDAQAALGDAWWELGDKQKPEAKTRYYDRAAEWYGRALNGLEGIQKVRLEKRLGSLPPSRAPIDLLRKVEPGKDAVHGTWTRKGEALLSDAAEFGNLLLPYFPPAEYDFRVTFAREEGDSDVVLFFSHGARTVCWAQGSDAGFASIKGMWHSPGNPTHAETRGAVVNGRPVTAVVEVRKDRFRVLLDGKPVKEWKTTWDDAGLPSFLRLPRPGVAVCSYKSPTRFLRVELVEVSGRGRPIR